jgi:hypothetical protein
MEAQIYRKEKRCNTESATSLNLRLSLIAGGLPSGRACFLLGLPLKIRKFFAKNPDLLTRHRR